MSEHFGLVSFVALAAASVLVTSERKRMMGKPWVDWAIDLASLAMHFLVLPILQIVMVYKLLDNFLPTWKGSVPSSVLVSVLFYVAIDYAWYWNHRIFHARTPLWNLHKTHHSAEHIDVFVTSRNSVMSHFLMVYFWFIALAVYLLSDPSVFLVLVNVGVLINFWGHTNYFFPCDAWYNRALSSMIVTPREHLWHHSRENPHCNFGTVLSIWDRLHGTMYCGEDRPKAFGETESRKVWSQLIWPF